MTLKEIFEHEGCDKALHFYHEFYETLPTPARLLEVGVFKGASIRAWRRFWPDTEVDGIDTFERVPRRDVDVGRSNAITVLIKGNSRSLNTLIFSRYDLLIDDGSHKPADQAATFTNLWPLVAPGGLYVIEDVFPVDVMPEPWPQWFAERRADYNLTEFLKLGVALAKPDDVASIQRHDFREKSGKPDSVLVEIRKKS